MPPIGETLREARMRQKLDVADVEERTKIRAKYLRALENEEWGLLPGPTFVRTFLRTYAEVVGLDPHLLIEEYRANHEPPDETELAPLASPSRAASVSTVLRRSQRSPRPERRRPARGGGPPGRGVVLLAAAVAVIAFLLVLGLVGGDDSGNDSSSSTVAKTETTPRRAARRPAKRKPKPAVPAGVTVRIAPTVPTYVCLDSGEGSDVVFEGILEKARNFKNARQLRLNLGKRSVAIRANGKAVKVQPSAEPLGLDVTRAGAKEISQGPRPCA